MMNLIEIFINLSIIEYGHYNIFLFDMSYKLSIF